MVMAVDMFLELTDIKGESVDKVHKGKIDVLSWSWGGSNASSAHSGGGSGAGKVNVQDLSITKYVDSATTALFKKMCEGKHIPKGKLIVRKAGGDKPLEYIVLELEKVFITSLSTGGSGGEDRLTEHVSLSFTHFQLDYFVQDEKGAGKSAGQIKWDIGANASV
jgi:type VI secretion system secreted protein Hcp